MQIRLIATVTIALALVSSVAGTQSEAGCLSYAPAIATLHGTLERKTFPGPPNYESIEKGDKAEVSWLLELKEGICIREDKTAPELNPPVNNVREVQLVLEPRQYSQYKSLVDKQVAANGTLFGWHTGHHHTPVLLTVTSLVGSTK